MTATERLPASLQRLLDAALDERAKSEQQAAELAEFNANTRWDELAAFVEKDLRPPDLWEHARLTRGAEWCGENLANLTSQMVPVYLPGLAPLYLMYRLRCAETNQLAVHKGWVRDEGIGVQTGPGEDDVTTCPTLQAALLCAFDAARKMADLEIPY